MSTRSMTRSERRAYSLSRARIRVFQAERAIEYKTGDQVMWARELRLAQTRLARLERETQRED